MELQFKAVTEEGPFEFFGEITTEEAEELLKWAMLQMLRRGLVIDAQSRFPANMRAPAPVGEDGDEIVQ
jgi:hypothetical protein